jgi:hypothetical protein
VKKHHRKRPPVGVLSILFICIIPMQFPQAQNEKRYQIRLSDDNITIPEATVLYSVNIRKYREVIEDNNIPPCSPDTNPDTTFVCYHSSPFPIAERDYYEKYWNKTFWAPVSEALNGALRVEEWEKLSKGQTVFGCSQSGGTCKKIIPVISVDPRERMLAKCEVNKVKGTFGPPTNCQPLMISDGKNTWIKVFMIQEQQVAFSMSPRFDVLIYSKPNAKMMSQAVSKLDTMLSSAPFNLITEVKNAYFRREDNYFKEEDKSILGTASNRVSTVLSAGRNTVREDVEIFISTSSKPPIERRELRGILISLNINIVLYVNSQNTNRDIDWVRPSKTQQSEYKNFVLEKLKLNLQSLCNSFKWDNSYTLFCDVPSV